MVRNISRKSIFGTLAILGVITLISFQNCARTNFQSDESSAALKSSGVGDSDLGVDPNPNDPMASEPSDGEDPLIPKAPQDEVASNLVECQMLHPNAKITLNEQLAIASNKQSTRICMSENACLKLINEQAVKHGCSFDKNAPASSETQCTEIFPGSKGTCHNATVLSDAQVKALLL